MAVFLGGLGVGVLLVGLLNVGTPDFAAQARSAQQSASSSATSSPPGELQVAGQANVNAACLRVINEARDTYGALAGLQDAVSSIDLSALDDIVRRLQPIQPRLASDLRDCQISVSGPGGPSSSGSASPVVPTPSATATR